MKIYKKNYQNNFPKTIFIPLGRDNALLLFKPHIELTNEFIEQLAWKFLEYFESHNTKMLFLYSYILFW